jgi:hypothetical protein
VAEAGTEDTALLVAEAGTEDTALLVAEAGTEDAALLAAEAGTEDAALLVGAQSPPASTASCANRQIVRRPLARVGGPQRLIRVSPDYNGFPPASAFPADSSLTSSLIDARLAMLFAMACVYARVP